MKKSMSIIVLNLEDNQFAHIRSCKELLEACKNSIQYSWDGELIKYSFCSLQVLDMQDVRRWWLVESYQQDQDICESTCLFGGIRAKRNVVMTLLKSSPPLYEHLFTTLEMMPMKELNMKFVMAYLMHEIPKKKEK